MEVTVRSVKEAEESVPPFFDFQLPRDRVRVRSKPHGSDILFVLIRGSRHSVRCPHQT